MAEIKCSDLTGEGCDFVATGDTNEETKANFYKHGGESEAHRKAHASATDGQKAAFGKKVDEYLTKQE